ncbi:MAG TPA: hypothetical protein VNA14_11695 [Mycobacteriales bacterium]|nr:hypothetical protein [Mycobacteriales bacterium]
MAAALAVMMLTALPNETAGAPTTDVAVSGDLAAVPHVGTVYRITRAVKSAKPARLDVRMHISSPGEPFVWLAEYERRPDSDQGFGSTFAAGATAMGVNEQMTLSLPDVVAEALLVVIDALVDVHGVSPGWRAVEDERVVTFVLRDSDTASSPFAATPYAVEQQQAGKFRVPARPRSRVDSIVWAGLPCMRSTILPQGAGAADLRGGDVYSIMEPFTWRCGGFDTIEALSYGPTTYEIMPRSKTGVVGVAAIPQRVVGVTIPR